MDGFEFKIVDSYESRMLKSKRYDSLTQFVGYQAT